MARTRSFATGHPRNGRFRQSGVQYGKVHPGFRLRRRPAARKSLRTEGQPLSDRTCGQGPKRVGDSGCELDQQPNDSLQLTFNRAFKVLSRKPVAPATARQQLPARPGRLYLRDYPLTRDVYIVLTDLRGTLPAGFTHFVAGDRGQRIILKSGLVPATRPIRTVEIKETF